MKEKAHKQKILIVDDSDMNRSILADMLGDEYEILEAEDGVQAVSVLRANGTDLSLLLLDFVMPKMNGFEVLKVMNKYHWIEDVPVIMISAERTPAYIERAYELGVTDFITRPFDVATIRRRVINTILLYAKQKRLVDLVAEQIYEKEKNSSLMVEILSHIVEFRNGESGLHVQHIHVLTRLLLKSLVQKTDQYRISQTDISLISTASALHDIGKIAIPASILNKPGHLTKEEFEIMQTHTAIGAAMLEGLPNHSSESLVRIAYEISRWHHERYDGNGYSDGLKGEEIPISAQVVSLADAYDALISQRVYKNAYSHEMAIQMIREGKCGAFNPLLLECLMDVADMIENELDTSTVEETSQKKMQSIVDEALKNEDLTASDRTLQLLEHERMKYSFFASMSDEVQFEYTAEPPMVTVSAWGAKRLGTEEIVMDPLRDPQIQALFQDGELQGMRERVLKTTPEKPIGYYECMMNYMGEKRWSKVVFRTIWISDDEPWFSGVIGKVLDIHADRIRMNELERIAAHDSLTDLYNHVYAKKLIQERLALRECGKYILAVFDLDGFKLINDQYGHLAGDLVLKKLAKNIKKSIRGDDIAARVGGDEFLIFLEYVTGAEKVVGRIYETLMDSDGVVPFSVSMGVAKTELVGVEYEELFHAADQALYAAKRCGKNRFCFYDETMKEILSVAKKTDQNGNT